MSDIGKLPKKQTTAEVQEQIESFAEAVNALLTKLVHLDQQENS